MALRGYWMGYLKHSFAPHLRFAPRLLAKVPRCQILLAASLMTAHPWSPDRPINS
jgi:hypothetical protein